MLPTTWAQITVVLAAVVPGFVYQVSRRRVGGPDPDEADVTVRVLRAIASSALFAAVYAIAFGPEVAAYLHAPDTAADDVRPIGGYGLALVVAVPWLAARIVFYVRTSKPYEVVTSWFATTLNLRRQWDPTPSAWDFAFSKREPGWVRIRTGEGLWVGGWFGPNSFASSFPDPQELYLEVGYNMTEEGKFTKDVSAPDGLFVRCRDAVLVDFIAGSTETDGEEG